MKRFCLSQSAIFGGLAILLTACQSVTYPTASPTPNMIATAKQESLTLDIGECYGSCPVYQVTLYPNGQAIFNGEKYTKIIGKKTLTLDPKTYQQTLADLRPYLPALGNTTNDFDCDPQMSDHSQYRIKWQVGEQASEFWHDTGCFGEDKKPLNQHFKNLPHQLGISELID